MGNIQQEIRQGTGRVYPCAQRVPPQWLLLLPAVLVSCHGDERAAVYGGVLWIPCLVCVVRHGASEHGSSLNPFRSEVWGPLCPQQVALPRVQTRGVFRPRPPLSRS